jgi:hypothetical protein
MSAKVFSIVIKHWMIHENEARKKLYIQKQKKACERAIQKKRSLIILQQLISSAQDRSPDVCWVNRRGSLYCLLMNIDLMGEHNIPGGVCPDCERSLLYLEPRDPDYTIWCHHCGYVYFSLCMLSDP